MRFNDNFESFEALHGRAKSATPKNYLLYKHAQMLHKLYNQVEPDIEWISLNFQHQFSMRRGHIIVAKTNNIRVGENILVNRLNVLNNKISLDWLNLPYGAYKRKIKELFLQQYHVITSNNYCKISGGGGNSLSKNMHYVHVVVNFLLLHKGLGALCAWEVACFSLLVLFLFFLILFNYLNVPAFKGVMLIESCFLRNAKCAC